MGIVRTLNGVLNTPDPKPFFSSARCINRKQMRTKCTLCIDLCPGKVFSLTPREPLKWDQCTNCGMCVSVCPSRCFAPDADMQKQYSEGINLSAPVSFACYSNMSVSCTRRVECLAGIPWELAAALALHTHVVFYVGNCGSCPHEKRVSCLHDNLAQLRDFLGQERFSARVHLISQGTFQLPGEEKKAVSRRDLLAGIGQNMGKTVARTALNLVPFLTEDSDTNGTVYRQLLADTVYQTYQSVLTKQKEYKKAAENPGENVSLPPAPPEIPRYGVRLPRYTTACYGCNICERICPHGAIEVSEEKEGKRTIYITPWKCTGCGLCDTLCPHKGLAGMAAVQVPHMNRLPLVRVNSGTCQKCGMAIPADTPNHLCVSCSRKRKW